MERERERERREREQLTGGLRGKHSKEQARRHPRSKQRGIGRGIVREA
jgi:hypothetical protein